MFIFYNTNIFDHKQLFSYSEGRLHEFYARGFGFQASPLVILRDPKQNEIELVVENEAWES